MSDLRTAMKIYSADGETMPTPVTEETNYFGSAAPNTSYSQFFSGFLRIWTQTT